MKRVCVLVLACGLKLYGGCALFGGDEKDSGVESPAPAQAEAASPAKADKPAASTSSLKGEARIRADLEVTGRELVGRAARTVMPSKAQKSVRKQGGEYVATYVEVDQNNVSTDMRPGKSGQYVGFIRYSEYEYECRGKSRQDALKGSQCERVRTRNLNEMIRYDGKKWQF